MALPVTLLAASLLAGCGGGFYAGGDVGARTSFAGPTALASPLRGGDRLP